MTSCQLTNTFIEKILNVESTFHANLKKFDNITELSRDAVKKRIMDDTKNKEPDAEVEVAPAAQTPEPASQDDEDLDDLSSLARRGARLMKEHRRKLQGDTL